MLPTSGEGSREGEEDVVLADICLVVFVWFGFVCFFLNLYHINQILAENISGDVDNGGNPHFSLVGKSGANPSNKIIIIVFL